MIKLVVSDVDGTLLKKGRTELDDNIITAIHRILEQGIFFAVASGRTYSVLRGIFEPFADRIAYLASDGSAVFYQGRCIAKFPLEKELGFSMMRDIYQQTDAEVVLYSDYMAYVVPKSPEFVQLVRRDTRGHMMAVDCMKHLEADYLKIGVYQKEGLTSSVKDILSYFEKYLHKVYQSSEWTEFTGAGVHKATGLEALMGYLGIDKDEVLAFGDNDNDIEMLQMAGSAFAMKDAKKEVKAVCECETECVADTLLGLLNP